MTGVLLAGCLVLMGADAGSDPEALLGGDVELLNHHRGYLAWLADHPEAAAREEAFLGLMSIYGFRDVAAAFDEALLESPAATRAYDTFYTHLAGNPAARERVERLARVGLSAPEAIAAPQEALTWLGANPEAARRFLENPVLLSPTPEALTPFRDAMRAYPEWWGLLREAFGEVEAGPEAYDRIVPWWREALRLDRDHGRAHGAFAMHLARYPNRFWVWHRRALALSEDAQTRNWIRYWHRLLRRSAVDVRAYYRAVRPWVAARQTPEKAPETWPPKSDPPALATYRIAPAPAEAGRPTRPERPAMTRPDLPRPERPGITYPEHPSRPTRPADPDTKKPTPKGVSAP